MNKNYYIENFYEEPEEEEAEEKAEEPISFCNIKIPESANNCGDPITATFAFSEKCSGLYVNSCKKDEDTGNTIFEAKTTNPDEKALQETVNKEFDNIFKNPSEDNKEDICKLMSIPTTQEEKASLTERLTNKTLADKFGTCNKETIEKLKKRCNIQQIQSSQCSIEFIDKLLQSCKDYNKEDTVRWDQEICPEKLNYKNDYFYDWASELDDKNSDEREEYLKSLHPEVDYKDNQERLAWVEPFVFEKIPFLREEKNIDKELEEDEYYQDRKYIPEIRAMKKCIIRNYLAPKNCDDQETVTSYLSELKDNKELTSDEYNEYFSRYNICSDNIIFEGKMVNRFCDWGQPRSVNFYNGSNYGSGDPEEVISSNTDIKEHIRDKLKDFGTKILEDDNDYFSAYTGLWYDQDTKEYIDLKTYTCTADKEDTKICKIKKKMHPIGNVDIEFGEDSDCTIPKISRDPNDVSYDIDNIKCPSGESTYCDESGSCCRCGQRRFYKSLNCKYRKNLKNIYGHGCEDPYATCVKLATKNEINNEKKTYLSGNPFDTTGIQSTFTSLKLEPQNFLTKPEYLADRIKFEKALEDNLTDKEKEIYKKEGIYKCMRCGLRDTINENPNIDESIVGDEIYSWKKTKSISNPNSTNFLIFHSQTDGDGNLLDTNCNEDDITWYKDEKLRLLKYFTQQKSLRGLDGQITSFDNSIITTEDSIQIKIDEFEETMNRIKEKFKKLEEQIRHLSPALDIFINEANIRAKEIKATAMKGIENPTSDNQFILYIIGFIIFCILIILLIF